MAEIIRSLSVTCFVPLQEVAGLKHTDVVQLLLAGGKKRVTFTMVPLEDTSIITGGRKRLASVSRRVSSREESHLKRMMRPGSTKRKSRVNVPPIFSRSRNGSRKKRESRETGNRSRSSSGTQSTIASPPLSAAPSQPTTPSPVVQRSGKSSKFSFGRLAKILNPHKSRRTSLTVSPLALDPNGSGSNLTSPSGNSPPASRAFSVQPPSPHTVTGAETLSTPVQQPQQAQQRPAMRRSVSNNVQPTTPLVSPASPPPSLPSPCSLPPGWSNPQHAAVMHDIKSSGSPLLRRALSPDSSANQQMLSTILDQSSPLASGSISTPNSPSQRNMRRSVSTVTPPRSRLNGQGEGSGRKLSWEERTAWFNSQ